MTRATLRRWLDVPRLRDPIDRRNGALLQVLLAVITLVTAGDMGLFLYLAAAGQPFGSRPDLLFAFIGNGLTVAAALFGLIALRRGHLGVAIGGFVMIALAGTALTYLKVGLYQLLLDPIPPIALAATGLALGRRALWRTFLALVLVCAIATIAAVFGVARAASATKIVGLGLATLGAYLLLCLVLNHTIAALRDSLVESESRRRALEGLNRQLRQAMADRERAQEQLLHAQRMEALGRLASGVAHDFDNVLSVIAGYATRREELADLGVPALLQALEGVEIAARRASSISRKLLSFARSDAGAADELEMESALRCVQPMLRQLLDPAIVLEMRIPPMPLRIRMDQAEFELMLLNLAANAQDAMAGRGRLCLDASATATDVTIAVADTGHGMDPATLARAFEPFYTTKPAGRGTGLGLAAVAEIVRRAGGQVRASSQPGQGSCFTVSLPRSPAAYQTSV